MTKRIKCTDGEFVISKDGSMSDSQAEGYVGLPPRRSALDECVMLKIAQCKLTDLDDLLRNVHCTQ